MKLTIAFLLAGAVALFGVAVGAAEKAAGVGLPVQPPIPLATVVTEANNAFAADLYAKLAVEKGNLFFSPNSIETALVMTYAGARGQTAEEMAKVLHLPVGPNLKERFSPAKVHQAFGEFLKDLNAEKGPDGKPRGYQLAVANALWGQKGFAFLPDFLGLVKDNYAAGFSEVDFMADTEGSRKTINDWVEKQTQDKIKELIKKGMLDGRTRLVLTNAIYFKSSWAKQFRKDATKDEPFHLAGGNDVKAPLMHRTGDYGYFEEDAFQGLKLPYANNELSMVVLLPKKADGLADLEKALSAEKLDGWMKKFDGDEVIVTLPKFKTTCEFNSMENQLQALGMKDAFTGAADFSGMDGKKDLFITKVVHKAFVDVSEEGTEAAAATAVIMAGSAPGGARPVPVFRADHPFIFLIRHEKTGAILFMGRVTDPTQENPPKSE